MTECSDSMTTWESKRSDRRTTKRNNTGSMIEPVAVNVDGLNDRLTHLKLVLEALNLVKCAGRIIDLNGILEKTGHEADGRRALGLTPPRHRIEARELDHLHATRSGVVALRDARHDWRRIRRW